MIAMLLLATLAAQTPLDRAEAIKERMRPTAQVAAEKMGREVSLWRPYGIQMELLKEDLVWLNRGYTPRQIMIVQAVVLGEALTRAAKAAKEPDEEQANHLSAIMLYRKSGLLLLEKILEGLGEVKDGEVRFHL